MTVLRTRPRLYLEIKGHGRFEVAQFSADFSKNMIPRASCTLAVGRKATDGVTPAKIHSARGKIKKMTRASVYFKGEGAFDKDNDWPDKYVKIFDGLLLGFGQQKIRGKLNVVVHLGHWAMDMNFSSSLSSQSHPANPTEYTFSATMGGFTNTGAASKKPFGIARTALADSVNMEAVQEDLWAKAIKPLLCNLAEQKHVRINGSLSDCVGFDAGTNDLALNALKRFEGPGGACGLENSCYTKPLSLTVGADVPPAFAQAIAEAIRSESVDSFAHNTLWGKLITYAAQFRFAIIPLVDKAIVVPFTPGLRAVYCKNIYRDEYDHIDTSGDLKRPVRGVAILSGVNQHTSAGGADRPPTSITGVGGCFAPADAEADGMIYFIRAPAWLNNAPSSGFSAARTLDLVTKRGTSSSTTPITIRPELIGTPEGTTSEDMTRELVEIYNGYAHSVYIQEALRGRVGLVSGKLRFDIAPGSTIKVQGSSERFLPDTDSLGQSIIGDVVRVSISIDAESPRAGTAIQINNCRTEAENADDKTSLKQHPLYTTEFTGAPLVDEFQFPNKDCC